MDYAIDENTTVVTTVQATDAQGDAITYRITGTDSKPLSIGSSSGVLEFVNAPDYENPEDANSDNVYEIIVVLQMQVYQHHLVLLLLTM